MTEEIERSRRTWRIWFWIVTAFALLGAAGVMVENWRGHRAFGDLVASLQARGEHFDLESLVPPRVPAEENFGEIPLFTPLFDYTWKSETGPDDRPRLVPMWRNEPAKDALEGVNLRAFGTWSRWSAADWRTGQMLDLDRYRKSLRTGPLTMEPPATVEVLRALSRFEPELAQVQAASALAQSRFPVDYEQFAPTEHLGVLLNLSDIASMRAVARLRLGETEAAAADANLALRLGEACASEPMFASLFTRKTMLGEAPRSLWEGLARHAWTEEQLAAFERRLAPINLVEHLRCALCLERNLVARKGWSPWNESISYRVSSMREPNNPPALRVLTLSGWKDQNRVRLIEYYQGFIDGLAGPEHAVDPSRIDSVQHRFDTGPLAKLTPYTVWAMMLHLPCRAFVIEVAHTQNFLHLTRIAVALERHRLRHGALPAGLDSLDADLLGEVPRDVATRRPPHYTPYENGSFQLYYDGWNGVDDGGVAGWFSSNSRLDASKGDVVWP